jgi:hypothetical protein
LWIIAERSAAAARVANTHGGALLSEFRAMGLGPPLNSVLESELNHDLLQESLPSRRSRGCLVVSPARLRIPGSDSELAASAKSYCHSLNSFLLEKADFICDF